MIESRKQFPVRSALMIDGQPRVAMECVCDGNNVGWCLIVSDTLSIVIMLAFFPRVKIPPILRRTHCVRIDLVTWMFERRSPGIPYRSVRP